MKDIEKTGKIVEVDRNLAANFGTLISQQAKSGKEHYLAWKYAEKWKRFVQEKKIVRRSQHL